MQSHSRLALRRVLLLGKGSEVNRPRGAHPLVQHCNGGTYAITEGGKGMVLVSYVRLREREG